MRRLKDDGLDKVKQGRTSIAEIARVANASDASSEETV
jgi:type II secretory ATPase GspE/PulE/Tfp pilus assembly ATPase PilB-like protein